jgi:hypothetical protein
MSYITCFNSYSHLIGNAYPVSPYGANTFPAQYVDTGTRNAAATIVQSGVGFDYGSRRALFYGNGSLQINTPLSFVPTVTAKAGATFLIQVQAPAVLAGNTVTVFSMSSTAYFLKVQIQSGAYVLVASTNPGAEGTLKNRTATVTAAVI